VGAEGVAFVTLAALTLCGVLGGTVTRGRALEISGKGAWRGVSVGCSFDFSAAGAWSGSLDTEGDCNLRRAPGAGGVLRGGGAPATDAGRCAKMTGAGIGV